MKRKLSVNLFLFIWILITLDYLSRFLKMHIKYTILSIQQIIVDYFKDSFVLIDEKHYKQKMKHPEKRAL